MANVPESYDDFKRIADQKASEMCQRIMQNYLNKVGDQHETERQVHKYAVLGERVTNLQVHNMLRHHEKSLPERRYIDHLNELRHNYRRAELDWGVTPLWKKLWEYIKLKYDQTNLGKDFRVKEGS